MAGSVEVWNGSYDTALVEWTARATLEAERLDKMKANRRTFARRLDEQHRKTTQKDAERMRVRRNAPKKDHDARGAVAKGMHNRGQKTGAKTVVTIANSLQNVTADIDAIHTAKELGGAIRFDFARANKEFLIRYSGPIHAGDRHLFDVDLAVRRANRIRIAGSNGVGKTSLLDRLSAEVAIPPDRVLLLHQETTAVQGRTWLATAAGLPPADRGRVMSIVASLGSDPGALLASDQPSPGEARKIALALGLGTPKWLLVLDEPTNHLDLPSIERLETALNSYEGAILLITHNDALAAEATDTTWTVAAEGVAVSSDSGVQRRNISPGSTPAT